MSPDSLSHVEGDDASDALDLEAGRVFDAFLADLEAGRSVDPARLLADHPHLASRLEACLEVMNLAGHALSVSNSSEGSSVVTDVWSSEDDPPQIVLRDPPGQPSTLVIPGGLSARALAAGRYRLLGEIARGGMGAVHKGHDADLGRDLAIKVLLRKHEGDHDALRRFIEEAQIGGQLQHPGIVPVYELGALPDRRPFFAMKLVQGQTLASLLAERPDSTHDLPRFIQVFEQICQTIAYAHARGVIHRDLKPSNVMVGAFGEVQVMDWGLAKVLARGGVADEVRAKPTEIDGVTTLRSGSSDGESRAGSVLGTPAYMAPEQARGETERLDERADVFGLGAILCEILTGKPPFGGTNLLKTREQASRGDTTLAFERLDSSGADEELRSLTRDCLTAEPSGRPRDASEVAGRVTEYRTGVEKRLRAAELARVEAQARAIEERKRRRLAVGLAAAILALVGAGGWWAYDRQARAARVEVAIRGVEILRDEAQRTVGDISKWLIAREAANNLRPLLGESRNANIKAKAILLIDSVEQGATAATADRYLLDELVAIQIYALGESVDEPDGRYSDAFRAWGIDLGVILPQEAGRAIARRPPQVALAIASAMDHWAAKRRRQGDRIGAKQVAEVARLADPDPWRNGLRDAVAEPNPALRKQALLRLAREATNNLPAISVTLLGAQLLESGEAAEAVGVLRPARDREPGDVWLNLHLARSLKRLGRSEEAIRFFTAAQSLLPESAHSLAHALADKGETEEAISIFRDVTLRNPDEPIHFTCLGDALKSRGLSQEANDAFNAAIAASQRLIRLNSASFKFRQDLGNALLGKGEGEAAIPEFREAIRLNPYDYLSHHYLGDALLNKKKLDEAIDEFRKAIDIKPDYAEAHCSLGNAWHDKGFEDAAITEFREVIRLKPDHATAHRKLGIALFTQRKVDAAIVELREAIRLEPDHAGTHRNLGLALQARGKFNEAIVEIREAIRLKPDDAKAHDALGSLLDAKGEVDSAIAEHRLAIRLDPASASAHVNLGAELMAKGTVDEAIAEFHEAIRLNPDDSTAHYNLGVALDSQGKVDQAITEYREAIRLNSGDSGAHTNLGNALRSQGKVDEAIVEFREAIRLDPNDAPAHCNLGDALRQVGEYAESLVEFRRGHESGSRQPNWRNPSEQWVKEAERLAALAERIPAVLKGEDQPRNVSDRMAFAKICYATKRYASAARLWAEALEAEPKLGNDRRAQHHYNLACAAARAGSGQGRDDPPPDEAARIKLRQQALESLKAELTAWTSLWNSQPKAAEAIHQILQHWKSDPDLDGVRNPQELAKLPEAEQTSWRALWDEVDRLLARANSR